MGRLVAHLQSLTGGRRSAIDQPGLSVLLPANYCRTHMQWRVRGRSAAAFMLLASLNACAVIHRSPPPPPPPPPPLQKITALEVRLPSPSQLPPVVGRVQAYR